MTICTQGPSIGRPNYIAARYSRVDQMVDEVEMARYAKRRTVLAQWEAEWIADGTLPGPGWLYQAYNLDGWPVGEPAPFAEAMERIWTNIWRDEPDDGKRIEPVVAAAATGSDSV